MFDELDVEHRLSVLEQDEKSVHRRLDNLEKLVDSVHIIATETKAMREDLNETIERVNEIERKPQKRLDAIITAIITAISSGLVGLAIGLIF